MSFHILKYSLCLIILISIISCKPKEKLINNISCPGKLVVQYDGVNYKRFPKPKLAKGAEIITVIFLSEYKDSINGYFDKKLFYNQFVDQRDSDHSKNYNFSTIFTKNSIPKLKVESISKKTCFDIEIDPRYSFVYVWLFEKGNWQIRFSNSYYLP